MKEALLCAARKCFVVIVLGPRPGYVNTLLQHEVHKTAQVEPNDTISYHWPHKQTVMERIQRLTSP